MKKTALALLITVTLIISSAPAFGYDDGIYMTMDVLLVRPLGVASTVFGTVLFIAALPISISSGSAGNTARALIVTPCKYTFVRPIGDFSAKWESDNPPSRQQ